MTICIVSMADPHAKQIGGKHIHQLLLERAYREKGYSVYTAYPRPRSITRRGMDRLSRLLFPRNTANRFIRYCIEIRHDLARQVFAVAENADDKLVFLTQDTISALAVKDVLLSTGKAAKICLTLHGYFTNEEINYQGFTGAWKERFVKASMGWENESAQSVDKILTVDTRIKNYVIDTLKIPEKKISVLFNAIDDSIFTPASHEEIIKLRSNHGIPKDRVIILVARRLVKKNGVMQALEAFTRIASQFPSQMLIAGDGPEEEVLKGYIESHGVQENVKMLGGVPHAEVVDYYRSADVILLPSTKSDDVEEATSLSMLEGMACGKVVIASAIGGMKEVITNGQNGYLFEDKNIDDLCCKLELAIQDADASRTIARNSANYARENHGYKRHAERYLEIVLS